jgi:hypothetical protein
MAGGIRPTPPVADDGDGRLVSRVQDVGPQVDIESIVSKADSHILVSNDGPQVDIESIISRQIIHHI